MMEFKHVQIEVYIGGWKINKITSLQVISSNQTPIDLATIEIPAEYVELEAINRNMPVKIYMGYYDVGTWLVFSGLVKDVVWGRSIVIYCKDLMEELRKIKVVQSFVDAEPAIIMKYLMAKAGVENYEISDLQQEAKHHFILSNQNILQAQRLLNSAWDLEWQFYREPEGNVVWQPIIATERYNKGNAVLKLEYGINLLALTPTENTSGTLTTFVLPFLRHSQVIKVKDLRYWAQELKVLINKIEYVYCNGSAEMRAEWSILDS